MARRMRKAKKQRTVRLIEKMENPLGAGRLAGMKTHQRLMQESKSALPLILDDHQVTMLIDYLVPKPISPEDAGYWRSGWLEGWFRVVLQEELSMDR